MPFSPTAVRSAKEKVRATATNPFAQEAAPPLAGRSKPIDHVLGDAGLSDLKGELEQFAMKCGALHSGLSSLIRRTALPFKSKTNSGTVPHGCAGRCGVCNEAADCLPNDCASACRKGAICLCGGGQRVWHG